MGFKKDLGFDVRRIWVNLVEKRPRTGGPRRRSGGVANPRDKLESVLLWTLKRSALSEALELVEEHPLDELLALPAHYFYAVRGQEEEPVGDRLNPAAQRIG
jgi:hypothetical protein